MHFYHGIEYDEIECLRRYEERLLCVYRPLFATFIFLTDFFCSLTVIANIAYDMGSKSADVFPPLQLKTRTLYATYVVLSTKDEYRSEFSQFISTRPNLIS